jgi:hypothetical protein
MPKVWNFLSYVPPATVTSAAPRAAAGVALAAALLAALSSGLPQCLLRWRRCAGLGAAQHALISSLCYLLSAAGVSPRGVAGAGRVSSDVASVAKARFAQHPTPRRCGA